MRKIVSFASTPNEAIKWSELGKYKRLSKEELYIYDFENIEEVHFIGSKKGENDYEIEETKWGIYINMEEAILLYICSWQTKEFKLLEKINKNIKCLDIRFTSINELDISEFDKINKLVLSNNRYLGLVNGIEKISGLRELYLNNSSIEKNPDLNNFPEIYVLNLSNTLISDLEGDEVRRNCKFLDLSNTKIKSCKTIQIFPNLRRLSLQETDIVSLKGIEQLKKLESLNCRDTRIETINEVMNLEALTSLNISYTNIKTLDKVMFPNTIRSLVMDGIGIKTIPVNICMLKNLRKLGISNMHLDSLPPEILDLQLNFNIDEEARKRNGINLFNTKIDNMDESVLQQPRTIISAWFKNNNRVRIPKKLNEAKVVFLGDGGAGKTFSIQRLLNNCEMQEEFSGESTPGISIQDCKYEINGEEILIHYWDFGGQEIMHSMHRMFLTKRTLYNLCKMMFLTLGKIHMHDWNELHTEYSYKDKMFLNEIWSKYGWLHFKNLLYVINQMHITELLPEIILPLNESLRKCGENYADCKEMIKANAVIINKIITKAFLDFNDDIKCDHELVKAFEEVLETLVGFGMEEAAVILDEFRVH